MFNSYHSWVSMSKSYLSHCFCVYLFVTYFVLPICNSYFFIFIFHVVQLSHTCNDYNLKQIQCTTQKIITFLLISNFERLITNLKIFVLVDVLWVASMVHTDEFIMQDFFPVECLKYYLIITWYLPITLFIFKVSAWHIYEN